MGPLLFYIAVCIIYLVLFPPPPCYVGTFGSSGLQVQQQQTSPLGAGMGTGLGMGASEPVFGSGPMFGGASTIGGTNT